MITASAYQNPAPAHSNYCPCTPTCDFHLAIYLALLTCSVDWSVDLFVGLKPFIGLFGYLTAVSSNIANEPNGFCDIILTHLHVIIGFDLFSNDHHCTDLRNEIVL